MARKYYYICSTVNTFLSILETVILVSVILFILGENKKPVHTLAWLLVVILFPIVGIILYYFFGREHKKRRLINTSRLDIYKERTLDSVGIFVQEPRDKYADLASLCESTNRAICLTGNGLKLYTEFYAMLDDLMSDMRQAKHHIHFQFFKFEDDPVGQKVAQLLIQKVQEGVKVRVQYDDAANYFRKGFYRKLRKAGVEVEPFIKIRLPFLSDSSNYRNHRKVVVIDGKIGYLGGMNIAQRYGDGLKWGVWRDDHLRVEGPAVAEMQTSFLTDWQFSSKRFVDGSEYYPRIESGGFVTMQVLTAGPFDEWRVIMQGIIRAITRSERYVYIQSPYFIPTEPIMLALRNAALAGIDVRIMIPYRGDRGVLVPLASMSYIEEALTAGVKVAFYRKGYMHSKTIVSDDSFVTVGSTNVDIRSYELDFEINAFIYDEDLAIQARNVFLEDEKYSEYLDIETWRSRSRAQKSKESFARLFSPLL